MLIISLLPAVLTGLLSTTTAYSFEQQLISNRLHARQVGQSPLQSVSLPKLQYETCGARNNNQKCSAGKGFGSCCSKYGYCGDSQDHCVTGCQAAFSANGKCEPEGGKFKSLRPSYLPNFADMKMSKKGERCGKEHNAFCAERLCCSDGGYCGVGVEYCKVPETCQRSYGWCDSMLYPIGVNPAENTHRTLNDDMPSIVNKCTRQKTLALSFDDGPSEYTNRVLDALKEFNARATFFLAGVANHRGQIDNEWTTVLRRMITEGHQIGSHTWSHPVLDDISSHERKHEMYMNERAIANAIGKFPTFMRAPRILCHGPCQKDMKDLGYHMVEYQYDSGDWKGNQTTEDAMIAMREAFDKEDEDGSVFSIQHDTHNDTAAIVRYVLQNMKPDWTAVPLVECLDFSLDNAYRFPGVLACGDTKPSGCLYSAPGFCHEPRPFTDKKGCEEAQKSFMASVETCKEADRSYLNKAVDLTCNEMARHVKHFEDFCNKCEDKKCNSKQLVFKQ